MGKGEVALVVAAAVVSEILISISLRSETCTLPPPNEKKKTRPRRSSHGDCFEPAVSRAKVLRRKIKGEGREGGEGWQGGRRRRESRSGGRAGGERAGGGGRGSSTAAAVSLPERHPGPAAVAARPVEAEERRRRCCAAAAAAAAAARLCRPPPPPAPRPSAAPAPQSLHC